MYTSYCLNYDITYIHGNAIFTCTEHAKNPAESTYAYDFAYSGEQCASAVLEVYAPVQMAALLLTSLGTAAAELLAPGLYTFVSCYREYRVGRLLRFFLSRAFDLETLRGDLVRSVV